MNFRLGFLIGLFGMALTIVLVPTAGSLTLRTGLALTAKFLREPFQINRIDQCPDVIDLELGR